jgi:hypothetical protein
MPTQPRSQPARADRHSPRLGQPAGKLPGRPGRALPGSLLQQRLDRVQVRLAELGRPAAAGPVAQRAQPTVADPLQRSPHGRLADRQLLGDLGHRLALVAQLHPLQADPQAGRHRGLPQPRTQLGVLVRAQPERRRGSGHDASISNHQP